MKANGISYRGLCEYVNGDGLRCTQLAYKVGERYCIHHDISILIAQAPRQYIRQDRREAIRARYAAPRR